MYHEYFLLDCGLSIHLVGDVFSGTHFLMFNELMFIKLLLYTVKAFSVLFKIHFLPRK